MKIFISYRRDDSGGYAGRLFDHLTARFGTQQIFMDVDTIQPGVDFRKAIENAVGSCDVALVMIGRQWLNIMDAQGKRRLDDPRDFVRAEVASALANSKVQVIPVLVHGAGMPSANDLPDDLKDLAWRNATELSDSRFQYDANKLIGAIGKLGPEPVKKTQVGGVRKVGAATLGGVFLGITALGLLFWMVGSGMIGGSKPPTPTSVPVSTSTNVLATSTPSMDVATPSATENTISPGITSTAEVSVPPTLTPSPQALMVNGARYTFPDLNTAPHCIAPEVATGEARAKYNIQVPKGWVMVWDSNKAFWVGGQYENNGLLVIYGEWNGSIEIEKGGSCSVPVEWLDFALKQRRGSFPVESRPEFYVGEQP